MEIVTYTYGELVRVRRKGYHNGNWRRLDSVERAFYKAATVYAKLRGYIMNPRMTYELGALIEKLTLTESKRFIRASLRRVRELSEQYLENRVFTWAPDVKNWLQDISYVKWLCMNHHYNGPP